MTARWALAVARVLLVVVLLCGVALEAVFGTTSNILTGSPYLVYSAIGLIITTRRPHNPIGWLFLATGATAGLNGALFAVTEAASGTAHADDWYVLLAAWAWNFVWLVLISGSTIFTLLLFPNGLMSRRWRPLLWAAAIATGAGVVMAAFATDLVVGAETYPNPLHPEPWGTAAGGAFAVVMLVLLACGVLAVVQAVIRFRRARGVERLQMQWFAFSAVVFAVLVIGSIATESNPGLSDLLFTVGAMLIPLSCGVAILRYHLYDLGRVVSRTTSYAIVTGLLLLTYAVVVTTVTRLLPESGSLAVAGATLAAAASARPLLRRVQGAVDRRFNRTRFDAQQTADEFGVQLRQEIDGDSLNERLVGVVDATLQPSSVALWLREA